MTRATMAESRAEMWFEEYLALGETRSLRRLSADSQRILGSMPSGQALPADRTLFEWSAKYRWDRRAKLHKRPQ